MRGILTLDKGEGDTSIVTLESMTMQTAKIPNAELIETVLSWLRILPRVDQVRFISAIVLEYQITVHIQPDLGGSEVKDE